MRAGLLRQRLSFERMKLVDGEPPQDESGQPKDDYELVVTLWGSLRPLSGRQLEAAKALQSEVTHLAEVRYYPGLTTDMRMRMGGRVFDILSIRNVNEKNRELQIDCREGLRD